MLCDKKLSRLCKRLSLKNGDDSFRFRINLNIFFFPFSDFCFDQLCRSVTQLTRSASRAGLLSWQGFKLSGSKQLGLDWRTESAVEASKLARGDGPSLRYLLIFKFSHFQFSVFPTRFGRHSSKLKGRRKQWSSVVRFHFLELKSPNFVGLKFCPEKVSSKIRKMSKN